jgi:hypothetical protein
MEKMTLEQQIAGLKLEVKALRRTVETRDGLDV